MSGAYFEHKSDFPLRPFPEVPDDVQVELRKQVDALFELAHQHGVRLHLKVRFPAPMRPPTETVWTTPTGRPATVHYPIHPLSTGGSAYTVALCTVAVERRRFTEDATRVTCVRCLSALAEGAP